MPTIIPLSNTTTTLQSVILNGVTYGFRTYFNDGASMWFLDISQNNAPIAAGLALVPTINILEYSPPLQATIGELRIVDLTGSGNATSTSLGVDAVLFYYTPGEFVALFPDFDTVLVRPLGYDLNDFFTTL